MLLPHNLALKQVSGKSGELTHLISLHQVTPDSFMHTATWLWRSHETKADDLPKTSSDERQQKRKASCLQWHQLHGTQHPSLSSPCCAVLTTKLKAMNRFQSYTFNVLAPHSKIEFECSWIQNESHYIPCHSSSMTFQTFIITKSFHSASNSLTHHYIGGFA